MPQMSPMMWTTIYISSLATLIFLTTKMFFNKKFFKINKKTKKNEKHKNWKW